MILGPTASGKSALAVEVARRIGAEVISVDSRQCFRDVAIGTAQPDSGQLSAVPHHNIACLEPTDKESVAAFTERRQRYESDIQKRNTPIVYAGGSTLHLQSIIHPLDAIPPANAKNLAQLKERAGKEGLQSLFEELQVVDPITARRMDGLNRHRIYRALDVWMQTQRPFHSFHSTDRHNLSPPEDLVVIGLHHERSVLHSRINERVCWMLDNGLIEETRSLMQKGVSPNSQVMSSVGYREIVRYLNGEWSLEEAGEKIRTSTRRYAKRQLTWFRPWEFVHWIPVNDRSVRELANDVLSFYPHSRVGSS